MVSVSISIDVPSLDEGVRFYCEAFGFTKSAQPIPGVAVLKLGPQTVCILEKAAGSKPSPEAKGHRDYARHWTPVHLDIHVDDLAEARAQAVRAGAVVEQVFENAEHGSAAFCSDPFGHGFCLIEHRA